MTIEKRIKIYLTEEEKKSLIIANDILNKLKIENPMCFLEAVCDGDWIYYDYDDDSECTAFEIRENNTYDPSEDDT